MIFVDFDYENAYDREKVAFTRAFWHQTVPERASERDFFTIISVFIVKIDKKRIFAAGAEPG